MDVHPQRIVSLCSGVGWLDEGVRLGLEWFGFASRVVAYVERDSYATAVLLARMAESSLEYAAISDSIDDIGERFSGCVDWIVAGFPCQPWSHAGKQQGTDDDRWLWPQIADCIRRVGPGGVFLENVPGLISGGGLEYVLSDLAEMGFDAEWGCLTAAAVGASHKRERVFIVAHHTESRGWRLPEPNGRHDAANSDGCVGAVANAERDGGRLDEQRRGQNRRAATGRDSEELALPAKRGQRKLRQPPAGDGLTDGGDTAMGDTRCNSGETRQQRIHRKATQSEERHAKDIELRRAELGDTKRQRPQGRRPAITQRRDIASPPDTDWRIFAPGPNADWRDIPEYLWPAIESGLCELVDGQSVVFDASRADQLRCAGNGCVALQAAAAFVELGRRWRHC